jgi:hypothetical protein
MVLHPDESTQNYGLDLLEQMPESEVLHSSDLVHELENFAGNDGVHRERAVNLLSRLRRTSKD